MPDHDPGHDLGHDPAHHRSTSSMWETDVASRTLGMELVSQGSGEATVRMRVREDMVNGYAIAHGGLVAALADSAFALACNSRGVVTVAAGFDIAFVESARLDDVLVATAHEVTLRGRSGIYDVRVTREPDGVVVAEFRGRSRALR